MSTSLAERAAGFIHDVPDYPSPGVLFKDITPLLANGPMFAEVVAHLAARAPEVDVVVGMEARGFILGAPVAVALGAGFVPVRKEGKLPRATLAGAYDLEYGSAVLEVHADTFAPGSRVLIVDDVLATGGTAAATVELLERAGAVVLGLAFLMELTFLEGRSRLAGRDLDVLLTY
ncbi:adenine phosphoribosyltransferase [Actinotalea sp.]|uniref:adenine phosphoribosyltransferase n=1 Tax=Actinotalea sp. TaxID=1872145 RepID=UPI002B7A046D|nr:adenine phosphoribosyltransferase [Actinotalea sp.]HQY33127.1 adenine phosphoribosyltransferase [Actinotalea sp.]HRA50061.1 adenine phosphoribosyltransferase [Actinotalea sp.]